MTFTSLKVPDAQDLRQDDMCRKVADALGISGPELRMVIWNIDNEYGADGGLTGHNIHFRTDSDRRVLARVKGLIDGCWVHVDPLTA